MGFQKKVNMFPARGVPGQQVGLNPLVDLLPVPVAGEGGVMTARAVWPGDVEGTVKNSGEGAPLGIVRRVMTGSVPADDEGAMLIQAGRPVAVVLRGDLLVMGAAAVTTGQKVFASLSTGELKGDEAGSAAEGWVETAWVVRASAAAGEVFPISNW